jgi:hypothetical protein
MDDQMYGWLVTASIRERYHALPTLLEGLGSDDDTVSAHHVSWRSVQSWALYCIDMAYFTIFFMAIKMPISSATGRGLSPTGSSLPPYSQRCWGALALRATGARCL